MGNMFIRTGLSSAIHKLNWKIEIPCPSHHSCQWLQAEPCSASTACSARFGVLLAHRVVLGQVVGIDTGRWNCVREAEPSRTRGARSATTRATTPLSNRAGWSRRILLFYENHRSVVIESEWRSRHCYVLKVSRPALTVTVD